MTGLLPSLVLAAAPLLAQVVPPANAPSPAPTIAPIGRVRATLPACVVTRDLVVPSFAAARKSDADFAKAAQKLRKYVEIVDDDQLKRTPIYREGALAHLDTDLSSMMKNVHEIAKLLGDPRLNSSDAQVVAMHDQLLQLYNAQATRANILFEYVMRERVDIHKTDPNLTDNSALGAASSIGPNALPTVAPVAGATFPPVGMPQMRGIGFSDVREIDNWSTSYAQMVRRSENQAAKTFLPIAQACLTPK